MASGKRATRAEHDGGEPVRADRSPQRPVALPHHLDRADDAEQCGQQQIPGPDRGAGPRTTSASAAARCSSRRVAVRARRDRRGSDAAASRSRPAHPGPPGRPAAAPRPPRRGRGSTRSLATVAWTTMAPRAWASASCNSPAIRLRSDAAARSAASPRCARACSASASTRRVRSSASPSATPSAHGPTVNVNPNSRFGSKSVSQASPASVIASAPSTQASPPSRRARGACSPVLTHANGISSSHAAGLGDVDPEQRRQRVDPRHRRRHHQRRDPTPRTARRRRASTSRA